MSTIFSYSSLNPYRPGQLDYEAKLRAFMYWAGLQTTGTTSSAKSTIKYLNLDSNNDHLIQTISASRDLQASCNVILSPPLGSGLRLTHPALHKPLPIYIATLSFYQRLQWRFIRQSSSCLIKSDWLYHIKTPDRSIPPPLQVTRVEDHFQRNISSGGGLGGQIDAKFPQRPGYRTRG